MSTKEVIIIAGLSAFIISTLLGPLIIPLLRRLKASQTQRSDGPESHLKKTGTPTMGGIIFMTAIIVVSLFLFEKDPGLKPISMLTLGFALVGFADDFIKVVLKRSDGLSPLGKSLLQLLVSGAYILYMYLETDYSFNMFLPFMGDKTVNFGVFTVPVALFIILGTVNGSNFTDGVDGLETSVTSVLALFFLVVEIGFNSDVAPFTAAVIGALLGFLLFNVNKAKVFMGDTGSLALGGFVAGSAFALGLELYLPIIALIYFVEVISVILQVGYFKLTKGKRLFRMAPIHHHFELGGWSETKVVGVFTVITAVLCAFALIFIPTVVF